MADNSRFAAYLVAAVLVVMFLLRQRPKADPNGGPTVVPPLIPIPYLGHVLGFFWYRTAYYSKISQKWNLPIVSLSMFGGYVYVISSPELMHSLHRQPRIISFWFIEGKFTIQLGGMSDAAAEVLQANLGADDKDASLLIEGLKATQHAMSLQGGMEEMNRRAAAVMKARLDEVDVLGVSTSIDLWKWVQHEITVATTESIYGNANPYRNPKVESAFWDFADDTIMMLVSNYLPRLFASKGINAREIVVREMKTYFETGGHKDSSPLTSARYAALRDHMSDDDLARFECVNGIAILANSVPTAFWAVLHVFSDPKVLAKVRNQVELITSKPLESQDGRPRREIDLHAIKQAPILFSAIQEALRHRATGTGPRMVMEDTVVGAESYRLKKGSAAIIANHRLHFDASAWGPNAEAYVADRFCGKTPSHAFRGFGGGLNLCPGKGFAMMEVATFVAMLAMRFDLLPEGGAWEEAGQDMTNMSLQIAPPKKRVMVRLVPRREAQSFDWNFVT